MKSISQKEVREIDKNVITSSPLPKNRILQKCPHRNILGLRRTIFPPIEESKLSLLQIDEESIRYITFHTSAQEITNVIMNNLFDFPCPPSAKESTWVGKSLDKKMKKLVITEMTAGVGGNVLNFANHFKYVNAIEINQLRYKYLSKNVKVYGFDNVNCYCQDSLELLIEKDDLKQDLIFFDPPWGGPDYKIHQGLRLRFGKYQIEEVCQLLLEKDQNKMVVIKLPNNYDFDYLEKELNRYRVSKYCLSRMTIVVVKNYPAN